MDAKENERPPAFHGVSTHEFGTLIIVLFILLLLFLLYGFCLCRRLLLKDQMRRNRVTYSLAAKNPTDDSSTLITTITP